MRRIIRVTAIVVAAFVAVVIALVMFVPVDVYRGPIEEAGTAATGRTLHLRGPLRFTLYPEIGISVSDVILANAPGARDPEMASVGRLLIGVRLWPLLSRRVEVTRLVLEKPVIHAEVGTDGVANWVMPPTPTTGPQAPSDSSATASFSLSNLRIEDGIFTYFDARSGSRQELQDVDVAIATTSVEEPFAVTGAATYKGHRLEFAGNLGNLGAALSQAETPASLSVSSDVVDVTLEGAVGGQTTAGGKLQLKMPSLREFANWLGTPLPAGKGLGPMSLNATVAVDAEMFSVSEIKLALDDMNVTGDFRLMTGGAKPAVTGKLSIDRLDLNPYVAAEAAEAPAAAPASASSGWSDAPISFEMLKAIDADLGLNVERLLVRSLEVQKAQVAVALKNAVLNTNLQNIVLYQGTGKGVLVVDVSQNTPIIKNSLNVSGLQAEPLLVAFLGIDRIVGSGNLSLDVTAQGTSTRAIIGALAGKGEVTFRDGMIKGVDLASVARTIQSPLTGASVGDRASTDFAELGGTFTINRGVLTNTDFRLLNPFVRMKGNGTVDLGNQSLDFHLEPSLVASTQGQGGQSGLAGVGIPFRVSGPWSNISYRPDIQNVGKALTGTLLDQLMRDKKGGQTGSQTKSGVGDVLKGLFDK